MLGAWQLVAATTSCHLGRGGGGGGGGGLALESRRPKGRNRKEILGPGLKRIYYIVNTGTLLVHIRSPHSIYD